MIRSMAVRYSKVSDELPDWMETSIDACRICAFCWLRKLLGEVPSAPVDALASLACAALPTDGTGAVLGLDAAGVAVRINPMEGVTILISGRVGRRGVSYGLSANRWIN